MGIHFPDGAESSSFGIGFTIPPNYTEGTPLIVHMDLNTPSTGCGIAFLGNSISVARPVWTIWSVARPQRGLR